MLGSPLFAEARKANLANLPAAERSKKLKRLFGSLGITPIRRKVQETPTRTHTGTIWKTVEERVPMRRNRYSGVKTERSRIESGGYKTIRRRVKAGYGTITTPKE